MVGKGFGSSFLLKIFSWPGLRGELSSEARQRELRDDCGLQGPALTPPLTLQGRGQV